MTEPLLDVRGLRTQFDSPGAPVRVLDGIDLTVKKGSILGLVGESGSGKSVTALSVIRLIRPPGRVVGGEVRFLGRDLMAMTEGEMRRVRGVEIGMIFQDPRLYLDPVFRVGSVMTEVYRTNARVGRREAKARSEEMLAQVGLPNPPRVMRAYPHQLSGGMAQRVMIALALAGSPKLLIADEPTTALDVTVQAQVIALLRDLRDRLGLTVVLITHNLSVVAEICDEAAVMYAGEIVERGPVGAIFAASRHPYTVSLLGARPKVTSRDDLIAIRGRIPSLRNPPPGCRFADRCSMAEERCHRESPPAHFIDPDHWSRCHFAERVAPVLVASSGEGA